MPFVSTYWCCWRFLMVFNRHARRFLRSLVIWGTVWALSPNWNSGEMRQLVELNVSSDILNARFQEGCFYGGFVRMLVNTLTKNKQELSLVKTSNWPLVTRHCHLIKLDFISPWLRAMEKMCFSLLPRQWFSPISVWIFATNDSWLLNFFLLDGRWHWFLFRSSLKIMIIIELSSSTRLLVCAAHSMIRAIVDVLPTVQDWNHSLKFIDSQRNRINRKKRAKKSWKMQRNSKLESCVQSEFIVSVIRVEFFSYILVIT
jgi:hypothetical protein